MSHDLKLLSDLLDEAFDLDERASEAFLQRIEKTQPTIALKLREMLQLRAALETDELLALNGRRLDARSALAAIHGRAEAGNTAPVFSTALVAGTMIGSYRLARCLGEGGMASVWLAKRNDETLKRTVALKLLHAWRHTREVVERFARERDILAQLAHPNIARLYDAGVTESGMPWIALEHVDGAHITTYADEHRLSVRQRVSLMLQVMEAVQYAHQNFVVHRDIKPGNILVDAGGQVHLLDFGIAKMVHADGEGVASALETALTEALGRTLTLRYAAPEQIEGGAITAATDVYALGLVTAELLAGVHPRIIGTNKIPQQAVLEAAVIRPSRADIKLGAAQDRGKSSIAHLQTELKGDLDTIVLKSLARDPVQRYATVSAFADDLSAWLERRPIRARAPSLTYQAKLFLSRNRWPAAMAATIVAVASFAAFQSWKSTQAMNEQRARTERLQIFMANLLADAEPTGGPESGAVTAKELIDRGRERANAAYGGQPDFRGEILGQLASVYLRIGETETGMSVLHESIQLLERNAPPDDPALNEARVQLGAIMLSGAEREKAIVMLERALRDCTRTGAACDTVKGDAHMSLAHDSLSGPERMLAHIAEALPLQRRARGPESIEVFQVLIAAADLERWRGNIAGAKKWLAEAEALAAKTPPKGKEHMRLYNTRAAIAFEDGNYAQAAAMLDRLIAEGMARDQSGTRGYVLEFRARVANTMGLPEPALEYTRLARDATDRSQGAMLYARIQLQEARVHSMGARADMAAKLVEDARVTLRDASVPATSETAFATMRVEGEIRARRDDLAGAKLQLDETLRSLRANPLVNPMPLVHTLDLLGTVNKASGHIADAISLHQEELGILESRVDATHPLRVRAALQLALARETADIQLPKASALLAKQLIQILPEQSQYRRTLYDIAAGSFKSTQALLLFSA